jgi:hypothetical protein
MTVTVRTQGDPLRTASSIVAPVRELDPQLVVANIKTMDEIVSDSVAASVDNADARDLCRRGAAAGRRRIYGVTPTASRSGLRKSGSAWRSARNAVPC